MTEKEKRDAGELYSPEALQEELLRCKELCFDFNALRPSQEAEKAAIIQKLFRKTGKRFLIQVPFWCDYGENIEIGEDFYANHNCVILDCARVTFGKHVFVGPDCGFYTAAHPMDPKRRNQGLEYARPITVGDNVWFGGGVRVLPGVTIGEGSVIAAGSVVTKDVPPYVVAGGNPCRVLRELTEEEQQK